jgi:hypothetical protein
MLRIPQLHLQIARKDCSNIPHPLKDSDDFQRTRLRIVDHDVIWEALNRPESEREICQVFANVPPERPLGQEGTRLVDGGFHSVRGFYTVLSNVGLDLEKIIFRLRSKAVEVHPRC